MPQMAYARHSRRSHTETVQPLAVAAVDADWTVLGSHDMQARFVAKGFEWEHGFPDTEFSDVPIESGAGVTTIVDAAVA